MNPNDHVGLVFNIAKSFADRSGKYTVEELVGEGTFGLMRAAEKFDPAFGVKFSTYAKWWIVSALTRFIKEDTEIRIPAATNDKIRRSGERLPPLPLSLDGLRPNWRSKRHSEDEYTLHEVIASDGPSPEETAAEVEGRRLMVREFFGVLTQRERMVLRQRYLHGKTLAEVAPLLDVSRERVRQIEVKALEKLRAKLEAIGVTP